MAILALLLLLLLLHRTKQNGLWWIFGCKCAYCVCVYMHRHTHQIRLCTTNEWIFYNANVSVCVPSFWWVTFSMQFNVRRVLHFYQNTYQTYNEKRRTEWVKEKKEERKTRIQNVSCALKYVSHIIRSPCVWMPQAILFQSVSAE